MRKISRRTSPALAGATLLCVVVLSACGSSGPQSTQSTQSTSLTSGKAPATVTFAYITGNDALPDTIAQGLGYFNAIDKQFHTNIVFQTFNSPVPIISGLVSGQLQFGVLTEQNGLSSAAQGEPLTDVVNLSQGFQGMVVANASSKASHGTGLAGLKTYGSNATVAITALQSISQVAVGELAKLAGVDSANLHFVATGVTAMIPSVASGRADLAFVGTGPAATGAAQGQTYNVVFGSGPLAYQASGFVPGFGLQASPSFVAKYPALIQAIVNAELKGLAYLTQNVGKPNTVYQHLPASYQASLPLSTFLAQWPYAAGTSTPATGIVSMSDIQHNVKLIQQYNIVPAGFTPPSNAIDMQFVKQYYKDNGKPVPTNAIDSSLIKKVPNT